MQANLPWKAARALAATGSRVRRAEWTDRYIFRSPGGLHWIADYDETYQRVVRADDFERGEFLALDWTDADPDQNLCVGIDLGAYAAGELAGVLSTTQEGFTYNTRQSPWVLNPRRYVNRQAVSVTVTYSWSVSDQNMQNLPPGSYAVQTTLPPGGSVDMWNLLGGWLYANIGYAAAFFSGVITTSWRQMTFDTSNYGQRVVFNPFASAVSVKLTGSVWDKLLLNGVVVRSTGGGGAFADVEFTLPINGSFTIAARSDRTDFPYYIGYDIQSVFRV
jgi:hypothetical protein